MCTRFSTTEVFVQLRALLVGLTVLVTLPVPPHVVAQTSAAKPSPWEPLRFFVGTWTVVGDGQPGKSSIERQYTFALNNRFLEIRNKSTYLTQEKNPKGEVHEDREFVSWDRSRRRFVFRQFHVERFVNQYVADSIAASVDSIVFTSESIENIPRGFRARETDPSGLTRV